MSVGMSLGVGGSWNLVAACGSVVGVESLELFASSRAGAKPETVERIRGHVRPCTKKGKSYNRTSVMVSCYGVRCRLAMIWGC